MIIESFTSRHPKNQSELLDILSGNDNIEIIGIPKNPLTQRRLGEVLLRNGMPFNVLIEVVAGINETPRVMGRLATDPDSSVLIEVVRLAPDVSDSERPVEFTIVSNQLTAE